MGFRRKGHQERHHDKGEDYVSLYRLEKWINQCVGCQARGYKPDMPDEVAQNKYKRGAYVAQYIRGKFSPLALDENGLCEVCRRK